ncbi:GTP pyrophosphokinase family protein [Ralstonia sp. Ralssp135]|uniref:GTP pyrophosphokinase n=1 Tax=Ralstonia sp. Ralssp135 TaxID=3243016 RepID=UPI0039AF855B
MDNAIAGEGQDILSAFDQEKHLYDAFGAKLKQLIEDLLTGAGISFHSVAFRCKNRKSLERKLSKPGSGYSSLEQITDICGLRVITYFEDDVEKVSGILKSEFSIDEKNSGDKAHALDPDRFGYLSVHHIVSNAESRADLAEYRKFNGLKAEIQIRSILQHAWAEIEHDLGYKSSNAIPREIRRQFSRLAGLLELADQEFNTIRDYLQNYSSSVGDRIELAPAEVELNAASLKTIVETSIEIKRLDAAIAKAGRSRMAHRLSLEEAGEEVERLRFFGINTAAKLMDSIREHGHKIEPFAEIWLHDDYEDENDRSSGFTEGVSLFYLSYILAAADKDAETLMRYIDHYEIGYGSAGREKVKDEVLEAYARVIN